MGFLDLETGGFTGQWLSLEVDGEYVMGPFVCWVTESVDTAPLRYYILKK